MVDGAPMGNAKTAPVTTVGGAIVRSFSIEGRAAVPRWIAWFALSAAAATIWFLILREARGFTYVTAWTAMGIVFAKLVTESVRRLHDREWSGGRFAVIAAIIVGLLLGSVFRRMSHGADLVVLLFEGAAAIAVAAAFLWPGSRGRNRYGPPPAALAPSGGAGGGGAVLAGVVLATFVGGGLAFSTWLDARERARMEQWRIGETVHRDLDRREREGRPLRDDVRPDGGDDSTSNRIDELLGNEAAL